LAHSPRVDDEVKSVFFLYSTRKKTKFLNGTKLVNFNSQQSQSIRKIIYEVFKVLSNRDKTWQIWLLKEIIQQHNFLVAKAVWITKIQAK